MFGFLCETYNVPELGFLQKLYYVFWEQIEKSTFY